MIETETPAEPVVESKPKSKFGKGWKKDVRDERDHLAHALLGAPRNLPPESLGLVDFVTGVNDQKATSSCVGQAITKAIHVRLRKIRPSGSPEPEKPSCQAVYAFASRRDIADASKPLTDQGCVPNSAMMAIREVGVPSEESWPFSPSTILADVPWDVVQKATKFRIFEWYRIVTEGIHRSDAIASALAQGFPVVFGLDLWQGFEDYTGGTLLYPEQDSIGGHMLCILGYRKRLDGTREFLILNSWGADWGEGGYVWLHENVLASERADDFYVIQVAA